MIAKTHGSCLHSIRGFWNKRATFKNDCAWVLYHKVLVSLHGLFFLSFTHKHNHVTPILRDLHWLPVEQRIKFKIILLVYKCLNNVAPVYLKEIVHKDRPKRQLRSSTKNLLQVVSYNLKRYGYRAFAVSAPRLWNTLPDNIRDQNLSIESFK